MTDIACVVKKDALRYSNSIRVLQDDAEPLFEFIPGGKT